MVLPPSSMDIEYWQHPLQVLAIYWKIARHLLAARSPPVRRLLAPHAHPGCIVHETAVQFGLALYMNMFCNVLMGSIVIVCTLYERAGAWFVRVIV